MRKHNSLPKVWISLCPTHFSIPQVLSVTSLHLHFVWEIYYHNPDHFKILNVSQIVTFLYSFSRWTDPNWERALTNAATGWQWWRAYLDVLPLFTYWTFLPKLSLSALFSQCLPTGLQFNLSPNSRYKEPVSPLRHLHLQPLIPSSFCACSFRFLVSANGVLCGLCWIAVSSQVETFLPAA